MSVELPVTGDSMSPHVRGSDVLSLTPIGHRPVRLGDVVAFARPDGRLVIHRVIAIKGERLRTRGDAASQPDAWIARAALLGRVEKIHRHSRLARWGLGPERWLLAVLSRAGLLRPLLRPIRYLTRLPDQRSRD